MDPLFMNLLTTPDVDCKFVYCIIWTVILYNQNVNKEDF